MSGWITERYERVPFTARKNLPCPSCGKQVRRQRTFEQTISPFNSNVTPGMTRDEAVLAIRAALMQDVAAWKAQPAMCTPCEEAES